MAWTQRQYDFTRRAIRNERQRRRLRCAGFHNADLTECGWVFFNELRQSDNTIAEVEISADGKSLFVKLADEPKPWSIDVNYSTPQPTVPLPFVSTPFSESLTKARS
jgi:hypothetical protein